MTTIYELEKQATPGPWVVAEESPTSGTSVWGGPNGDCVGGCDKWPENMMLAAHCRNHFMEALEVLKEADQLGSLIANPADIKLAKPIRDRLRSTIRKLETIE